MTSGQSLHRSTIPRIECTHQGKRSLGVRAAPDGTFLQEFDFHLSQARHWAANISKSPLTRTEVFTAFHSLWHLAIEYPLAVTSYSRDQCLQLQKAYTGTFLSHMGIASTTSRALIFGSSTLSGFNRPELWVSQGTSHLTYLLGHLNADDNVGTLLRIMLDTLQLHLGFPLSPALTYPYYTSISRYFDPSWLSSTWDFMTEASALLTLSDQWTLPLDRQNDCHLMPRLVSLATTFSLSTPDLIKFNRCRLYLQVLTLSDIVDSSGNTIDTDFWKGYKNKRISSLSWPKEDRPGPTSWTIWRRLLCRLCTIKSRSPHLRTQSRLYAWLPSSPCHQRWPTYFHPLSNVFYGCLPSDPTFYSPYRRNSRFRFTVITNRVSSVLPSSAIPISVLTWHPSLQLLSHHPCLSHLDPPPQPLFCLFSISFGHTPT